VSPVTALQYPFEWMGAHWLSSSTVLVPSSELETPDTTAAELNTQGYLEMAQSQSDAKAAAFTHLGYAVGANQDGALIFAVQSGAPADDKLSVGEIVTAVNGVPTPNSCSFVGALHFLRPGDVAHLRVEHSTVTENAVIRPGPLTTVPVRLGRPRSVTETTGCPGISGRSPVYLGVEIETQIDYTYPFPVNIDTSQIGGPSAGLAMTLGIIDALSTGRLTGHQVVAATGTIDASGQVGDVGGVPQKTVAVERAGATVFFVPSVEYRAAESRATPSLHVYPVDSLDQVLSILKRLGGSVPGARAAAPVPSTTG
jgi:PDZ domain-containing protein